MAQKRSQLVACTTEPVATNKYTPRESADHAVTTSQQECCAGRTFSTEVLFHEALPGRASPLPFDDASGNYVRARSLMVGSASKELSPSPSPAITVSGSIRYQDDEFWYDTIGSHPVTEFKPVRGAVVELSDAWHTDRKLATGHSGACCCFRYLAAADSL